MPDRYIRNITFDCAEPHRLAAFWAAALGYDVEAEDPTYIQALRDHGQADRLEAEAAVAPPDGVGPRLYFNRVPEPKVVKNRVHIDINAVDMDAEVQRLTALGARVLRRLDQTTGPYHELWTIMSDPEGNEFCVQHAPPRAE